MSTKQRSARRANTRLSHHERVETSRSTVPSDSAPTAPTAPTRETLGTLLTELIHAQNHEALLRSRIGEHVARLRAQGATWDTIASMLGVTRRAAIKTYGHRLGPVGS